MPLSTRHYRTAFAAILLALTTLLSACSIWPKALSFPTEPKAEVVVPPPATVETAVVVSAPPTVTELPKIEEAPPAKVAVEPVMTTVPKAETTPKPLPPTALAPGFYINVGLFAVPDNANTAYRKLEKAGLPVFSDVVAKALGPQTRVRVGPYPTHAKAIAATKKIKALKLDAVVFKH